MAVIPSMQDNKAKNTESINEIIKELELLEKEKLVKILVNMLKFLARNITARRSAAILKLFDHFFRKFDDVQLEQLFILDREQEKVFNVALFYHLLKYSKKEVVNHIISNLTVVTLASLIVKAEKYPLSFFEDGWWDKWHANSKLSKNKFNLIEQIIKGWAPHQFDTEDVAQSKKDKLKLFVQFLTKRKDLYEYIGLEHYIQIYTTLGDTRISQDFFDKYKEKLNAQIVDAFTENRFTDDSKIIAEHLLDKIDSGSAVKIVFKNSDHNYGKKQTEIKALNYSKAIVQKINFKELPQQLNKLANALENKEKISKVVYETRKNINDEQLKIQAERKGAGPSKKAVVISTAITAVSYLLCLGITIIIPVLINYFFPATRRKSIEIKLDEFFNPTQIRRFKNRTPEEIDEFRKAQATIPAEKSKSKTPKPKEGLLNSKGELRKLHHPDGSIDMTQQQYKKLAKYQSKVDIKKYSMWQQTQIKQGFVNQESLEYDAYQAYQTALLYRQYMRK